MWLIPLVSIPLIIHILSRRRIKIVEFSSIQFLKKMEHESIKKLQIIQILLLIIRTLMILSIVMMISRPVYKGVFSDWVNDPSSTFSAIVIDDTFSNTGEYEFISRQETSEKLLNTVLSNIEYESHVSISTLSKGEVYNGLKSEFTKSSQLISNGYSSGAFIELFANFEQNIDREYANKELFIISDAQESNFQSKNGEVSFEEWNVYFYKYPKLQANLSIDNVEVVNDIPLTNSPIDIQVSVVNNGTVDAQNVLLQLIIEDINVGQQVISLKAGKTGIFNFTTAFSYPGIFNGFAEISKDNREEDNKYYFNINLPKILNISIIGERSENLLFVKTPLNTLNQDSTMLNVKLYTRANFGSVDLRNQNVVVINGLNNIPTQLSNKLLNFLKQDGHLILFPDIYESTMINLQSLGIKDNSNPIIEYTNDEFQLIEQNSVNIKSIKKLFNVNEGSIIKIFKYLPLLDENNHQMQLKNSDSVWNRYNWQSGTIDLFGFALDLEWTNFPLKGAYIPFWHTLIYSTVSSKIDKYFTAGENWIVKVPYYTSNNRNFEHVSSSGDRFILSLNTNNTVSTRKLESIGFHQLTSNGNSIAEIAVNIPNSEIESLTMSDNEISKYFEEKVLITSNHDEFSSLIKSGRLGIELWRWFLIVLCALIVFEMILSNLKRFKNA